MKSLSCRKIENGIDDFLVGNLAEDARIRFEMHLGTCEQCRESIALWNGFANAVREEPLDSYPPLVERRMVIAALARRGPEPRPSSVNWKRWASMSLAAAAVAVFALFITLSTGTKDRATDKTQSPAQVASVSKTNNNDGLAVTTMKDGRQVIAVSPGTNLWLDKDAKVLVEHIETKNARFRLEEGRVVAEVKAPVKGYRFVVATPNGEVEAKGTVFSVEVGSEGVEKARVMRGSIEVRQTERESREVLKSVVLQAGEESKVGGTVPTVATSEEMALDMCVVTGCPDVELESGDQTETEDEQELSDDQAATADVVETEAVDNDLKFVITGRSSAARKGSGSESVSGPSSEDDVADDSEASNEKSPSRTRTLVSLALERRRSGGYSMAAETYRQLIREYPGSEDARNALVSLGQLELVELGRPKAALDNFRSYLKESPRGFLAEEARLGVVRALNKLGRMEALIQEASEYLYKHPGGYAGAEVLRLRGDAKRRSGDCKGAVEDYNQLKAWWPASRQNEHAKKGMSICETAN